MTNHSTINGGVDPKPTTNPEEIPELSVQDAIKKMEEYAAEQRFFDVHKMGLERDMATSQALANTANKASDRISQK